jgi:hypothetical protein
MFTTTRHNLPPYFLKIHFNIIPFRFATLSFLQIFESRVLHVYREDIRITRTCKSPSIFQHSWPSAIVLLLLVT